MKKVISIILLLLICMLSLSGCWDMREINEIGLVMAVGIDKSESDPNNYLVTVQIANPKGGSTTGQTNQIPSKVWIASAEGKTIFEAIRNIAKFASHRIMWAHNNIIIIGESVARDDITPVINIFTHNYELRMKTLVAVGPGKASDFLVTSVGMGDIPGLTLSEVFRNQRFTGLGLPSSMLKVFEQFTSDSTNPLMAVLTFNEAVTKPDLKNKTQNTQAQIEISGAAVFDETKMLGYLTADETRGLAWFLSKNPNIVVSVPESENSAKSVAVEVSNVKADVKTQLNNDNPIPIITVSISGAGSITEEDSFSNLSITAFKTRLEAVLNDQIAREIETSIAKVQKEYRSDVLDFGHIVHAQHKNEWHEGIGNNWGNIFPEAEVNVEVKIDIQSSSLYQIPFYNYNKERHHL